MDGKGKYQAQAQEFATSYICQEIPWKALDFESDSESDIPIPFRKVILLPPFLTASEVSLKNEISKCLVQNSGNSGTRTVKASKVDSDSTRNSNKREFAFFKKGQKWLDTNRQLVSPQHCPKLNSDGLTKTFSEAHQEAMAFSKKSKNKELWPISLKSLNQTQLPLAIKVASNVNRSGSDLAAQMPDSTTASTSEIPEFCTKLQTIFGEIQPLHLNTKAAAASPHSNSNSTSQPLTQYQQAQATLPKTYSSAQLRLRTQKPTRFWKKNTYPPKSRDEVIAERRRQAPRPNPEYFELDYLPGIWEPQLMCSEFNLTGPNYDGRIAQHTDTDEDGEIDERYEPVDWYQNQAAREKCLVWLNSAAT